MASALKPQPSLSEKIARQREERADFCDRAAGHHAGSAWAINYKDDARQWREAATRARAGDLSPFSPQ